MIRRFQSRAVIDVDKDDDHSKPSRAGYAWESSKIRSWDQIEEDPETGRLKSFQREEQIARKKRRDDGLSGVRRGIIRFCVLIIDMSETLSATDLKPSRAYLIGESIVSFAKEFFDQNPISQLSIVVTRDGEARKESNFSSNERDHADAISRIMRTGPHGVASLQNALNVAIQNLDTVPSYGLREIVVCFGSLSTIDPGDIHNTIDHLASEKIRCSALGMGAELHVLHVLTKKTGGSYVVAMHEDHFRETLNAHVVPPPTTARQTQPSLIRMGYPILQQIDAPRQFCNNPTQQGKLGYHCPRCSAWLSEMPVDCTLCGISLVSSPHLARSYHHLFPVPKFVPLDTDRSSLFFLKGKNDFVNDGESVVEELLRRKITRCAGCKILLRAQHSLRLICPRCMNIFCLDCDTFIHDSLHHCPGCGTKGIMD